MPQKKRVAILGGGMSSLVTAFELTNQPDWKDRYESITVFQLGWRLGGKGASGRNEDKGQRIEEHGLHVLFGCYENTFRIMRNCYDELPQEWPWNFDDAFEGEPEETVITMYEPDDDDWKPWPVHVPTREGIPGAGAPVPWGVVNILKLLLAWAKSQVRLWPQPPDLGPDFDLLDASDGAVQQPPVEYLDAAEAELDRLTDFQTADIFTPGEELPFELFLDGVDNFLSWVYGRTSTVDRIRRALIVMDLSLTISKGLVRDRVVYPADDWFAIDKYDLRDWLERHGAREETRHSSLVQGLYDAIFSWNAPVGAGTILHAFIRASHYKGSLFYRMQAGMGDVIFAPLFQVLRDRGVQFEFFHRVESLALSADRSRVETVRMQRQVRLKRNAYEPLVDVDGLPCWPDRPKVSEIDDEDVKEVEGRNLENWWDGWKGAPIELKADEHFDILVLGISIGAFPYICRELIDDRSNPAFQGMVTSIATIQTQALQLWKSKRSQELGWDREGPIVIPYAEPLDTWADMTHLLAREQHPASVKSISYLCSSLDDEEPPPPPHDHEYPGIQKTRVLANARRWLDESAARIWPGAATGSGFDWDVLHSWSGSTGVDRLEEQHYCATLNPSDRYVRAVPGSNAMRLRADESGYANLYLTGDWTKTAMSVGCLESATMGGIQTARAIDARVPKAIYDWLPERGEVDAFMTAARRSRYVKCKEDLLVVPPVGLKVDVKTFILPAKETVLKRLCDDSLNLGSPAKYRPAGPFVVLYCCDMDHVVTEGSIGGQEIGIWVPVIAEDDHGNDRRLLTYTPLLWVNSSPALVGGRAVYGFPKHMGKLTMPRRPGDPAIFAVDATVMPVQGGDAEEHRLITVQRRDGQSWEEPNGMWNPAQLLEILKLMIQTTFNMGTPTLTLLRQLFEPAAGMPMVFLKQFPRIDGTWDACYQAILEAPVEITGGRDSGPIPGSYEVEIARCWSHEIVARLGLEVSGSRRTGGRGSDVIDPLACGWMTFKSQVQPGRVIWQA